MRPIPVLALAALLLVPAAPLASANWPLPPDPSDPFGCAEHKAVEEAECTAAVLVAEGTEEATNAAYLALFVVVYGARTALHLATCVVDGGVRGGVICATGQDPGPFPPEGLP